MQFIRTYNRKNFLIGQIPKYYPGTSKYISWWRDTKRKCIEGVWIEELEGRYRYMPPKLYFYVNFGSIVDEDITSGSGITVRPELRDLEWELAYLNLEARKFSGFKDDDEFSSHRLLADYYSGNIKVHKLPESCISIETKQPKKYISARENLKQLHLKPKGPALYENEAKNTIVCGSRGGGKSFWNAHSLLHEIIFDGAKFYNEQTRKRPTKVETFIGSGDMSFSKDTCQKLLDAMNELAINPDLGAWGDLSSDDYEPCQFYKDMSGVLLTGKDKWIHNYDKKVNGRWLKGLGTKSYLKHRVFTVDNPNAASGGRYSELLIEEVGLITNLIDIIGSNEGCLRRRTKTGSQILIGTSGNMEKVAQTQRVFNDPESYDMIPFINDWENSGGKIGFFLPCYYTHSPSKDDNGNTILEEAMDYFQQRRNIIKKSRDPKGMESEMMNFPFYPSEMWIKPKGNLLPSAEIIEVLRKKETSKEFELYTKGELVFDSEVKRGVKFKPDVNNKLRPITHYPLASNESTEGALVIYEPPIEIDGEVPPDLYIVSCDPVAQDGTGTSLACIHVLKIRNTKYIATAGHNQLVAEVITRPYSGRREVNELLEKLNMYYGNGPRRIYYENNVGNVKEYFERRGKLWMLATEPQYTFTNRVKTSSGSVIYGYSIRSKEDKMEAAAMLYQWLLTSRGKINEGGPEEFVIRNLDLIPSRFLLQQMASYDLEGNWDAVSSFFGCMIGIAETINIYKEEVSKEKLKDTLDFLNNNKFLFPNQKQQNNKLNLKNVYWNLS